MKRIIIALVVLAFIIPSLASAEEKVLKMSTTTSTESSGLLEILLPAFKKDMGIDVKVIAKGTGAALRDGMDGNVDVVFVHDPDREAKFVAEGYGTKRYAVMHNDFLIVGPAEDPAGIKGEKDAALAMKRIGEAGLFVSRGDDSGTHIKEQELWKASGIAIKQESTTVVKDGKESKYSWIRPDGVPAYASIGQGMGKTLTFAEEKQGYTLTDRGTYVNYKVGRKESLQLEPLCEGDPKLFNPYGVIPVNPQKFPQVKYELAETFAKWLVSARGQGVIAGYKLHDNQLFFPDAQ